jgi:hypothetical protein
MTHTDVVLQILTELKLDADYLNLVDRVRLVREVDMAIRKIESMEADKELLLKIINKQIGKRRKLHEHARHGSQSKEGEKKTARSSDL